MLPQRLDRLVPVFPPEPKRQADHLPAATALPSLGYGHGEFGQTIDLLDRRFQGAAAEILVIQQFLPTAENVP